MLNFKKLLKRTDERKTVTAIEKDLLEAIHNNDLDKFKVVFSENKVSPNKICYVRTPAF
jgi:hypothetical protein